MQLLKRCRKQRKSCAMALSNWLIIKEHVFYSSSNTGQKVSSLFKRFKKDEEYEVWDA